MKVLLDNDVFFAAIYAGHQHHEPARTWLDREKKKGWAISTETWLAAMRLLMNPAILGTSKLNGATAWKIVKLECGGQHPVTLVYPNDPPHEKLFSNAIGHRQVMDFWLVQLAKQEKLKVVTFDRALKSHWPDDVQLLKTN